MSAALDRLISGGLAATLAAVRRARRRVVSVARRHRAASPAAVVELARAEIARTEPELARTLAAGILAAWVAAARGPARELPAADVPDAVPPAPPFGPLPLAPAGDDPARPVRWPALDAAARDLLARRAVTPAEFERLGEDARRTAFTVARAVSADAVAAVRDAVAANVLRGGGLAGFRRAAAAALDEAGMSEPEAETLYRTHTALARAAGTRAVLDHPDVQTEFPYVAWHAVRDGRVRPDHLAMESAGIAGTNVYRADDPQIRRAWPPCGWNCFLPETQIRGRIELATRFWYRGKAVEVTISGGERLRVTANHPVLTPKGFLPAQSLKKGDHVLRYRGGIEHRFSSVGGGKGVVGIPRPDEAGAATPRQDEQHKPATAEEVFGSFAKQSGLTRMPVRTDDFHGDAVGGNGQVDVVSPDRELLLYLHPSSPQLAGDFGFPLVDRGFPGVAGLGSPFDPLGWVFAASSRLPSGLALSSNLVPSPATQLLPLQSLRIGLAADLDASRYEHAGYGVTTEAEFATQLQHRHSAEIAVDVVSEVRDFDWSGHVYDFQAEGGWLIADSVVVSNCRCVVRPVTLEDAAAAGVPEARVWLRTGTPPVRPAWVESVPVVVPRDWPTAGDGRVRPAV